MNQFLQAIEKTDKPKEDNLWLLDSERESYRRAIERAKNKTRRVVKNSLTLEEFPHPDSWELV